MVYCKYRYVVHLWVWDKILHGYVFLSSFSMWSSSTAERNLLDAASRMAREEGIKWHKIVITNDSGEIVARRYKGNVKYRSDN